MSHSYENNLLRNSIYTGDSPPVKQRHYPYSPYTVQKKFEVEIKRMLQMGVIRESESSWNNPIRPVIKEETGKTRLCLDARKLNTVTKTFTYPLSDTF